MYSQAPVGRDLLANRLLLRDYYLPLEGITAAAVCCGARLVLLAEGGRLLAADLLQERSQQGEQQQAAQAQQRQPVTLAERLLPQPIFSSLGRVQQLASHGSRLALLTHSSLVYCRELRAAAGPGQEPGSSREELQQQLDLMMLRLKLQAGEWCHFTRL